MKYKYILMLLLVASCASKDKLQKDPLGQKTDQLIRDQLLKKESPFFRPLPREPLPFETPILPPALLRKVTIQLGESQNIRKVFLELCHAAQVNVMVDPEVDGVVFYQAKGRPLIEVIDALCHMLHLRARYKKGLLIIQRDLPYSQTYDVQFLNIQRKTKNSMAVTNNILSKSSSGGAGANGSTTEVSSEVDNAFWDELSAILKNILHVQAGQSVSHHSVEKIEEKRMLPAATQGGHKKSQQRTTMKIQHPASFSVHRQAGLITIYGTQKDHRKVQKFLKRLHQKISSQILIEAKVLEVTLKEEFKSGIDWQRIGQFGLGDYAEGGGNAFRGDMNASALFGSIANKTSSLITTPETNQMVSLGMRGRSLSGILNFMETFGVVRTLSSPRLTVLNNQTAVLKVAENFVFFNVTGDRQFLNADQTNYGSLVTANSTPQTIPIGFVMHVQPAIDPDRQDVILNLRPTITRLIDTKEDPAVVLLNQSLRNPAARVKSEFPVVAVREIDSLLRIQSGGVAILGGLMIEGSETGKAGIPGTTDGPFSFLTASKRKAKSVTELVIFLRATILEDPVPDKKDRDLYESFTMDTRPLTWRPAL